MGVSAILAIHTGGEEIMDIKNGTKVKVTEVKDEASKRYIGFTGLVVDVYKEIFGKKKVRKYVVKMDVNSPEQGTVLADKVEVI